MVCLRLQKRLAASVLKCGKRRVWMDPNETNELALANSRQSVRKLVKDGFIVKKQVAIHSRARARLHKLAVRKGRHCGMGRRKGTAEARTPSKYLWIKRTRVLRRLLRKYREAKKVDKTLYHQFYMAAKGNQFKNRRVLIEAIHKAKNQAVRDKALKEQQDARRDKSAKMRSKKLAKTK
jgi:large subunit ribosomal protein L19e